TAGVLQVTPAEVLVQPGDTLQLNVRSNGTTEPARGISWGDTKLPVSIDEAGVLTVSADAAPGAAVITGVRNGVNGSIRVRVVPGATFAHDFDNVTLAKTSKVDGGLFEFPPSHWIGAKLKWEVRDLDGDKVLAKTLDRPLFQRTQCFIGHPGLHDYTAQVDIRTDGNRRSMSSAGIINQRYIIRRAITSSWRSPRTTSGSSTTFHSAGVRGPGIDSSRASRRAWTDQCSSGPRPGPATRRNPTLGPSSSRTPKATRMAPPVSTASRRRAASASTSTTSW
ncbi:MAG: hypothetical protein ACYTGR_16545, partial [Planctomycetota bacterium]